MPIVRNNIAKSIHFSRRYGPVGLEVRGNSSLAEELKAEFRYLTGLEADFPRAIFEFPPDNVSCATNVDAPMISIGRYRLSFMKSNDYHVHSEFEYTLRGRFRSLLPPVMQRLVRARYNTVAETQKIEFIYTVFIWIMQLTLLRANASFVHASSLADTDGRGVLFGGWGGTGKTSVSSFLLVTEPSRWSFLSDDLSILEAHGRLSYNPIHVHIYPYNTDGLPDLASRLYKQMGRIDRMHWEVCRRFLGPRGVVRRLSPAELYVEKTPTAELKTAMHFERFGGKKPVISDLSPDEFADASSTIAMYQFRPMQEALPVLSSIIPSAGWPKFPTTRQVHLATRDVILKAIRNARTCVVRIPMEWTPEQLGNFIKKQVLKL